MALMGYREYARHRVCTLRAVQKAIEAGRITLVDVEGKKKIDSDQADRDWVENTDPAKQSLLYGAVPAREAPPAKSTAGGDDVEDVAPVDEDMVAYRKERAERESINKQRDQLALDRERGQLVDRDEVARLRFTEFRALRDALGNVGARIKAALAAESDVLRCEQMVQDEIEAALSSFADEVLSRGVMSDGDDEDEEDPGD